MHRIAIRLQSLQLHKLCARNKGSAAREGQAARFGRRPLRRSLVRNLQMLLVDNFRDPGRALAVFVGGCLRSECIHLTSKCQPVQRPHLMTSQQSV